MITAAEAYSRACSATDLTIRPDRQGAADVVAAAGMVRNRLGTALLRLRNEWDSVAVPDFSRYTDFNSYNSDMILLFGSLKTWREASQRLADYAEMHGIPNYTATRVLWWWLDSICDACHGTGYQVIEGGKRLSDKVCPCCEGSGHVPVPGGEAGRKLATEMEDFATRAAATLKRKLR